MITLVRVDDAEQPEPPPGVWDRPLEDAALLFVDLETTGTDPAASAICELAAIRMVNGREIDREVSLVRAPPVGESATIHGIHDEALVGAPELGALRSRLAALSADAVVVGHRIGFDLAFWAAASERGELAAPPTHALCTRALARRAWHRASFGLAALCEELDLPAPAHRAEPDARACAALLGELAAALRARTPRQLWQAQRTGKPIRFRDDVADVLRRAAEEGRPARIAYRVPGRHAFVDELEVRSLEPPRVEGRLRERGLVKTLRGDRLLWAELI